MASKLDTLLSSTSYKLAYAIPLLLLSLVLTFSGAFLTLDRTRSFAPKYDTLPGSFERPKRVRFALEGGVGGILIGYAFGVHLSTFLSLLIPAVSSSQPLSSGSFIAVWVLSSALTTFLAARWKYCALAFAGMSGGALLSLAISVIIHPSLTPRIILVAIFTPATLIVTLLPLARIQHGILRLATAATGAFGVVVSAAALANVLAWENVWERLWENDGDSWGTKQEQGLSAGYCLFVIAGIVSDWLLKRFFGECPDEKWDSYLANYSSNLPNQADRAGHFRPLASLWDRIFGSSKTEEDVVFPDFDGKLVPSPPMKLQKYDPTKARSKAEKAQWKQHPEFLQKSRSKKFQHKVGGRRGREPVKFGKDLSDSSDSEEDEKLPLRPNTRPWLRHKSTNATLVDERPTSRSADHDKVDYDKEIKKLGELKGKSITAGLGEGEVPEYSDHETEREEDVVNAKLREREWSPGFKRQQTGSISSGTGSSSDRTAVNAPPPPTSVPLPLNAVPATPSLMKALDRVAAAQRDAFGASGTHTPASGLPPVASADAGKMNWDEFWKDVAQRSRAGNDAKSPPPSS